VIELLPVSAIGSLSHRGPVSPPWALFAFNSTQREAGASFGCVYIRMSILWGSVTRRLGNRHCIPIAAALLDRHGCDQTFGWDTPKPRAASICMFRFLLFPLLFCVIPFLIAYIIFSGRTPTRYRGQHCPTGAVVVAALSSTGTRRQVCTASITAFVYRAGFYARSLPVDMAL
jgi:hypothetical protein